MANLNYYITQLSNTLFISYGSDERNGIDRSLSYLKSNIKTYFGTRVNSVTTFGSFTRGTIIPRKYDLNSDVDLLIDFNKTDYPERTPETYRNNLKTFADAKYPRSVSNKDLPSIMLELSNIKFDLVPSIIEESWFSSTIYIPKSGNEWQETDPKGFNSKLTEANQQYNSVVKPIIRLLKYWNHRTNYPFASYELEQIIADMNFSGDTIESGFYYAIDNLPTSWRSETTKQKVNTLVNNKNWIQEYLRRDNIVKAKETLHRILP